VRLERVNSFEEQVDEFRGHLTPAVADVVEDVLHRVGDVRHLLESLACCGGLEAVRGAEYLLDELRDLCCVFQAYHGAVKTFYQFCGLLDEEVKELACIKSYGHFGPPGESGAALQGDGGSGR
jgi:hypothetical protein